MTQLAHPEKHEQFSFGRAVLVGLIAGVVMAVIGVFALPLLGLSNTALPVVVGAITGIVALWIGKSSELAGRLSKTAR